MLEVSVAANQPLQLSVLLLVLEVVGSSQPVIEVPGSYSALVTAGDHQQHLVAACGQKCTLSPLSTLTDVSSSHSGSGSQQNCSSRSRVVEEISTAAGLGLI